MNLASAWFGRRTFACLLLAIALFIPKSHLLPIFPYALLALSFILVMHIQRVSALSLTSIIFLTFCALTFSLLSGKWESWFYFVSSLTTGVLAAKVISSSPDCLIRASRLYLGISLLALLVGGFGLIAGAQIGTLIDSLGQVRARALNGEPNFMGFSLVVIYILLLFYDSRPTGKATHIVVWALALSSFSIYALGSLLVVTTIYSLSKRRLAPLVLGAFVLFVSAYLMADRIEAVRAGVDNSANFRTWGAIYVAYEVTQEECGLMTGCGIGSSRVILEGSPLMERFSAHDVLPNLAASTLMELGLTGVFSLFAIIFLTAFGHPVRRSRRRGFSFAVVYCLSSYALSASYLYDPHFWSTIGLFFAVLRSGNATVYADRTKVQPTIISNSPGLNLS